MKVLQINSVYDFGSTGKITADIHRLLPQYGIESVVCYGRRDKSHEANVYQICNDFYSHIEHFRANVTGVMYGGCELSTYRLKKIIEKEKPDVVCAATTSAVWTPGAWWQTAPLRHPLTRRCMGSAPTPMITSRASARWTAWAFMAMRWIPGKNWSISRTYNQWNF